MKCVAVMGSPRKNSNSSILAETILETAKELGAETEAYQLSKMNYSGCIACGGCKTKADHCVVEDDLYRVLESIRSADAVILSSPIYFGEVSGQFKSFFDRTYSYLNPDFTVRLQPGKRAAFILSQGQPGESVYSDVFPRYERWLKIFGFVGPQVIRITGVQLPNAVREKPELLERAQELARKWMEQR